MERLLERDDVAEPIVVGPDDDDEDEDDLDLLL
jgi:hypothetical protein